MTLRLPILMLILLAVPGPTLRLPLVLCREPHPSLEVPLLPGQMLTLILKTNTPTLSVCISWLLSLMMMLSKAMMVMLFPLLALC